MTLLIHESAMASHPQWVANLTVPWRVATKGTPIGPTDSLVVSWELRHKAAASLKDNSMHTIVALKNQPTDLAQITNRNASVREEMDCIELKALRRRAYDNGSTLWYTMPSRWTGRVWFNLREVFYWTHGNYQHLLDQSYVRPVDILPYLKSNWKKIPATTRVGNTFTPKYQTNEGRPRVTLRQALEIMPREASVMATVAGFPFEMVPRNYLIWLVADGSYTYREDMIQMNGQMKTALDYIGNSMRQSILYYLDNTKILSCSSPGVLEFEEDRRPRGSFQNEPESLRAWRKQYEHMDFQYQDLNSQDFSTYGHWDRDIFIPSGCSRKIRFISHGSPTWLEAPENKSHSDFESFPANVQNGVESWERTESWVPPEKIKYDWRPARKDNGELLIPGSLRKAYERLLANRQRLENWNLRMDWFCQEWAKGRSESSREELEQEYTEQLFILKQIRLEYQSIYLGWSREIPELLGMKKDLELASARDAKASATPERELASLIEQVVLGSKRDSLEYKLIRSMINTTWKARQGRKEKKALMVQNAKHLNDVERDTPAVSWNSVEQMHIPRKASRGLKLSLAFAKTQSPFEKKRMFV